MPRPLVIRGLRQGVFAEYPLQLVKAFIHLVDHFVPAETNRSLHVPARCAGNRHDPSLASPRSVVTPVPMMECNRTQRLNGIWAIASSSGLSGSSRSIAVGFFSQRYSRKTSRLSVHQPAVGGLFVGRIVDEFRSDAADESSGHVRAVMRRGHEYDPLDQR